MSAALTLTTFTPAEAERITGVPTVQQRDWRRRGFLPSNAGHARFDAFNLAELLTLKRMAERDIGLQAVSKIAPWVTRSIVWHALGAVDAYEGDYARIYEWQPNVYARLQENIAAGKAAVAAFSAVPSGDNLHKIMEMRAPNWSTQADWLRDKLWSDRGYPRLIPTQYFIWWATGEEHFDCSLDRAFGALSATDPKVQGAVLVLDHQALGDLLLDRAGRALVHVEIVAAD